MRNTIFALILINIQLLWADLAITTDQLNAELKRRNLVPKEELRKYEQLNGLDKVEAEYAALVAAGKAPKL